MVNEVVLPTHETSLIGIPVVLLGSVRRSECKFCGEPFFNILFPDRLTAAAAVCRAKSPTKLLGREIKFLRKALNVSAKELADFLDVKTETLSRWENDKQVMGPNHERLLRVQVGLELGARAPAIHFDAKEVLNMNIKAVRDPDYEEMPMVFELVKLMKVGEKRLDDEYSGKSREVA